MAVRLVGHWSKVRTQKELDRRSEKHWANFGTHEDLIRRCFYYLIARYPHPESQQEAYHDVLLQLFALNVFNKFDRARLVMKKKELKNLRTRLSKKGMTKRQVEKAVRQRTDPLIEKQKINVDKKFEQFIYKWIEQILNNAYRRRSKDALRFLHTDRVEHCHRETYNRWKQGPKYTSWDERIVKTIPENISEADKRREEHRARSAPVITDSNDFVGEQSLHSNPLYKAVASDTLERIEGLLETPLERAIVRLRNEGLNGRDVAYAIPVHCVPSRNRNRKPTDAPITPSYVSLILNRIHARCVKNGVAVD